MAYRIFWTPIAVQDLRGVCDFISQDNPAAAQRFVFILNEYGAFRCFPNVRRGGARRNQDNVRSANGGRGCGHRQGGWGIDKEHIVLLPRHLGRPAKTAKGLRSRSLSVIVAHARRNCRDWNSTEPWACCECDCTRRLEAKLQSRGQPFLEALDQTFH
jgi:hypothetical protein